MPGESHRNIHFFIQNFQRAGDTFFAVSTQAIEEGAADHGAACAQCPGFQNILAATDTAVEPHFDIAAHSAHHIGQGFNGGRRTIELAAAVVGNNQRIGAAFYRQFSIFRLHNAFDNQLAAPQIFDAGHIVPAQARVELLGGPR